MPKYLFFLVFLVAIFGLPDIAGAESGLVPHRAEYRVKISVLSGRLNTELRQTKNGYVATHLIEPTGIAGAIAGSGAILAESEFQDGDDGIVPLRYKGNDELSSDRLRVDIAFDWNASRASGEFQTKDDPAPVAVDSPLDQLVHDPVSIQYELMTDLANGEDTTEYVLFEHDRVRTVEISRVGTRRIKTGAGTFNTIGIRHQAQNSSRATTLWIAMDLGYLPVMIERHRKGKLQMRAELQKYEPEST
jgi:hypothetical protein